MKIAILGSSGQLGFDLTRLAPGRGHVAMGFVGRAELDITNPAAVAGMLDSRRPEAVINTAAFHNVDLCETEAEAAYRTNVLAVRGLAQACESRAITLVHIGTDYVMEGDPIGRGSGRGVGGDDEAGKSAAVLPGRRPIPESAAVHPKSVYALTRFGGDMMTLTHAPTRGYVVRSCGLFGVAGCKLKGGLNFVDTMIKIAREGRPLSVVSDQIVAPTPTDDLAVQLLTILENLARVPPGIYHAVAHGECSWHEFAKAALQLAGLPHEPPALAPVLSAQRPTPAQRPHYSVLDNAKLRALGLDLMTDWRTSLARYIQTKYPR